MILGQGEVERYLALAREVGRTRPLYDVHVSPYEVVFCRFAYRRDPARPGVYGMDGPDYVPPHPRALRVEDGASPSGARPVPSEFSLLMYRQCYAHVGPRVLADHMALCGIRRSLLVPVLRAGGDEAAPFELMFDLYRDDPRFAFAWCPPRDLPAEALAADLRRLDARFPLRAVKLNPNIQGIDLAEEAGRERVARVLLACRATGLPLMVHGGVSRVLADPRGRAFASLENLGSVEWRQGGIPVVLGHAGMFGCAPDEVGRLLPRLQRLMAENGNVLADVSGLPFEALCAVLREADGDRLLFGSDALYFPQWSAVVKVLFAFERLGRRAGDEFLRLAGTNPERHLFREPQPAGSPTAGTGER